ncbi:DNA-binding protein [bacterium]|nr:DNA-binding protein [bacterium]
MQQFLTRKSAAEYLSKKGIRSSNASLARAAMGGDGPPYVKINGAAYYTPEWLDQWLEAQMLPQSHSLAHAMAKMGRVCDV